MLLNRTQTRSIYTIHLAAFLLFATIVSKNQSSASFIETAEYKNWIKEQAEAERHYRLCIQGPNITRDTNLELARDDYKRDGAM